MSQNFTAELPQRLVTNSLEGVEQHIIDIGIDPWRHWLQKAEILNAACQ